MPLGNPIRKQNESRIVSVLATEGQSVFTVQGGYIINQISVFRNGVRLSNSEDFTAGDGSTVTLNNEANVDDRIEFHIFDRFTVQNAIVGAASSQTISGDVVVNGKIFGNLQVSNVNTGIVTATELDVNGKGDISGDLNVAGVSTFTNVVSSGVVTATTFVGAVTGNVTGNISGGTVAGSTGTFTGDVDIADKIVHTGDTNTAIRFPSADTVSVETGGTEALRVDSSQRLVLGATSQRTVWGGQQKLSIEGLDGATSSMHIVRNSNDAFYPFIALGKSRGTSDGSSTIVQDDDVTGIISFNAADGGDMNPQTAYIASAVDGTPGTDDMPGRLVFYTTADGAYNSSERLRITSAGNIGINESSPSHKLVVGGDIGVGFNTPNDAARQLNFNVNRGSAGQTLANINWQWNSKYVAQIRGMAGDDTTNKDDGHLTFYTSAANNLVERLRIQSDGYVWLNKSNPQANSHIVLDKSGAGSGSLRFYNAGSQSAYIQLDPSEDMYFYAGSGVEQIFYAGGSRSMTIDTGGKLLLGSTSDVAVGGAAGALFQVETTSQNGISCVSHRGTGNASGSILILAKSRGTSAGSVTAVASGDELGALRFAGADGTDLQSRGAEISCEVDTTPGSNDMPGRLLFKTTADGASTSTERVRIDSSGRLLIGHTSVGSKAAAAPLQIQTASSGAFALNIRNRSSNDYGFITFTDNDADEDLVQIGIQRTAANTADLFFYTNGGNASSTEKLRITSGGRLLVNGTSSTSPDGFNHLIQVNAANHEGGITIGRHTANANGPALIFQKSRSGTATPGTGVVSSGDVLGTIRFYASDGTDRNSFAANIACEVDATPGSNDMPGRLIFSTTADGAASSTERMRITKDGDVGFGLGSSYAPECPVDVFANWSEARSNVAISNSWDRKLPLNERGDITITTRHSPSKDGAVGYVGPIIDFRSTNASNEEWTVAQIVGGTDPLGGTSYQGGLSIFASNGGQNDPSGRRDQGDAPTLAAVFAPFRLTTFTTTSAQGNMAIHVTKNHAANNVQSDMIAFDVGGGGRGKIVSASSGSGSPSFGAYSDRRLKTNFRDYTGGYDRIKAIPVKLYDEVLNDQTKSVFNDYVKTDVIGWIADEVQSVFPEAVMGTKDQVATADDVTAGISTAIGDPIYQSLTEGIFLPDAIQAIQKLIEKVETLETKVAALESS